MRNITAHYGVHVAGNKAKANVIVLLWEDTGEHIATLPHTQEMHALALRIANFPALLEWAKEAAESERARADTFEDDELIPSWLCGLEDAIKNCTPQ